MRPEPSPQLGVAGPADDPEARDDDPTVGIGAGRGASLARAARLLSENRTEFSLRCPVRDDAADLLGEAAMPPSVVAKRASASPAPDSSELSAEAAPPKRS